ncbi:MAG: flagellar export protein FliJ [Vicinamibacterales bacterium]
MARFRFRAAAALELRQQQEQAAAATLAQEEGRLREIAHARDEVDRTRADARRAAVTQARAGTDAAAIEWHRNWILGLGVTIVRLTEDLERQAAVVGHAEQAWREARRRRLALEKMRDRALRRFQQAEARIEMKDMDELARLRFLAAAADGGGDQP